MTLSARIAIDPSRRIARWAVLMPAGGVLVACVTLTLRWPACAPGALLMAAIALVILAIRQRRLPSTRVTLAVSASSQVDVQPALAGIDASWRLAESTMAWPGFAVIALRPADDAIRTRVVRMPVLWAELAASDRRALGRYLVWSLSGRARPDALAPRH